MDSFTYWLAHAIFTNQILKSEDGGSAHPMVMRPDGVMIPAAVFGTDDKVTYWKPTEKGYVSVTAGEAAVYNDWLLNSIGAAQKVEHEQEARNFVTHLWDQFNGGDAPKVSDIHLTERDLRDAILATPEVSAGIAAHGYTEAEVWSYAQHEAPWALVLVGVAETPPTL